MNTNNTYVKSSCELLVLVFKKIKVEKVFYINSIRSAQINFIKRVRVKVTLINYHLMSCSFMLCHPLGGLAALGGRELSHSDLSVAGTHGQG